MPCNPKQNKVLCPWDVPGAKHFVPRETVRGGQIKSMDLTEQNMCSTAFSWSKALCSGQSRGESRRPGMEQSALFWYGPRYIAPQGAAPFQDPSLETVGISMLAKPRTRGFRKLGLGHQLQV